MSQIYLATTGTPPTVVIPDLGNVTFVHPVLAFPLLIPDGPYLKEELADSADLQAAVTGSEIILTDESGNTITNVAQQAAQDSYVKVSIDDTTPATLSEKIAASGLITGTILGGGGDETLELNFGGSFDGSDVPYDDTGATAGSPADGETNVQDALTAVNNQTHTNTGDIAAINASVGAVNGIAPLDGSGLLPTSVLPDLAIADVYVVADIAARNTLSSGWGVNQEGDTVVVTDAGADPQVPAGQSATYIWNGASFNRLVSGDNVNTVNGQVGTVILDAGDIGYSNATSGLAATDVQAALDEIDATVDGLGTASHAAATSGDDAIDVTVGQVISLNLDGVTGSGDNIAVITASQGLYVPPPIEDAPYIYTGVRGNQTTSTFLRAEGNADFTNQNPYRLPYDIQVIAVTAHNRLSSTPGWTAEVYINGAINAGFTSVVGLGTSSVQNILGAPITISAGDEISTRANLTGGAVSRPTILLTYRRV